MKGISKTAILCGLVLGLHINVSFAAEDHVMLAPTELIWSNGPDSLPPGAQIVVLEGDPSKAGEFTVRLKFPANYKIPPHFHPVTEHITVVEGDFNMAQGDTFDQSKGKALPVGGFVAMPKNTHHYAWTNKEAIVQLHGIGPWGITYLDPKDDPRKKS